MTKTAYRILKSAPEGAQRACYTTEAGLAFVTNGEETLSVPADRPIPGLQASPASEAPTMPPPIAGATTDLSGAISDFTEKLRWVLRASGRKDVRFYLNGLFFDAENAKLVGTDGHRLHVADVPQLSTLTRSAILPRESAQTLLGLITETGGKRASLRIGISDIPPEAPRPKDVQPRGLFAFYVGDTVLQVKAIDGIYPDWKRIKAEPSAMTTLLVDLPSLAHKHKAHAKMIQPDMRYHALRYNDGHNQITIADGTVLAAGADLPKDFGLNIQYAADARVPTKRRPMCFVDKDKFCLEADDRHVTIMNMRL